MGRYDRVVVMIFCKQEIRSLRRVASAMAFVVCELRLEVLGMNMTVVKSEAKNTKNNQRPLKWRILTSGYSSEVELSMGKRDIVNSITGAIIQMRSGRSTKGYNARRSPAAASNPEELEQPDRIRCMLILSPPWKMKILLVV